LLADVSSLNMEATLLQNVISYKTRPWTHPRRMPSSTTGYLQE
jgi:hypothetical protein